MNTQHTFKINYMGHRWTCSCGQVFDVAPSGFLAFDQSKALDLFSKHVSESE